MYVLLFNVFNKDSKKFIKCFICNWMKKKMFDNIFIVYDLYDEILYEMVLIWWWWLLLILIDFFDYRWY